MKSLTFGTFPPARSTAGRRIREARFERRSLLPASAACVVANGVRETLAALLGAPVGVRLLEPIVPDARGWEAIVRDAVLYRVRGSVADAALVLRAPDAAALASAVFGEPPGARERELSPIERDVVDRAANAIAANLSAICGLRESHAAERTGTIAGFVTFFELLLEQPMEVRIGIALSRDPAPEPRGSLELGHLRNVPVSASASLDLGKRRASAVVHLSAGTVLPMRAADLRRCTLSAAGRPLARGTCGARNGRFALLAEAIRESP